MLRIYDLHKKAQQIVASDMSWEQKYDLIFNQEMSKEVFAWFKNFGFPMDYYDPDSSYEEDVCAFMHAFDESVEFINSNDFLLV